MKKPRLRTKPTGSRSAGGTEFWLGPWGPQWLGKWQWVENVRRPNGPALPTHPASPEAPPAVWSAVRALAHGHHLAGAEGLPQEHREGALDVQDGGGPLRGGEDGGQAWVSRPQPRLTALKAGMIQWASLGKELGFPAPTASGLKTQIPTGAWQKKMNEEGSTSCAPGHHVSPRCWASPGRGGDWGRPGGAGPPPRVKEAATSHLSERCQAGM